MLPPWHGYTPSASESTVSLPRQKLFHSPSYTGQPPCWVTKDILVVCSALWHQQFPFKNPAFPLGFLFNFPKNFHRAIRRNFTRVPSPVLHSSLQRMDRCFQMHHRAPESRKTSVQLRMKIGVCPGIWPSSRVWFWKGKAIILFDYDFGRGKAGPYTDVTCKQHRRVSQETSNMAYKGGIWYFCVICF